MEIMRFLLPTLLIAALSAHASTRLPLSEEDEWGASDGALRGRVESVNCAADPLTGRPVTRAVVLVQEAYRGKLPPRVEVEIPGGTIGGSGEDGGDFAALRPGEERLFFLNRTPDGRHLRLSRGDASARKIARGADGSLEFGEVLRARRLQRLQAADVSPPDLTPLAAAPAPAGGADVAGNGSGGTADKSGLILANNATALPARWVAPDRGEPIGYIVDATVLPVGITQSQALTAVSNALAAWTVVTGMTFRFEGLQDFGKGADFVLINDEKIRIQLHDTWGSITTANTIGIGGREWSSTDALLDTAGGGGGQVAGLEFHKAVRGYVVMRHTAFTNLKTFEEVLCHELGHVFGLAHSSVSPTESNATLRDAMMYYTAHADNRGARLGAYDPPMILKAQPLANTPPWAYPRFVTAHTGAQPQTAPGVNEYPLTGYDRQTPAASLTLVTGPSASAPGGGGTFTFAGLKAKYTPASNYSDNGIGDPYSGYFAKVLYRISDGANCSPWQVVNIISYKRDTFPSGTGVYGDGLPDAWMTTYWGNANPAAGPKRGPTDDYDDDGLTNLQEYRLATNPTKGSVRFDITIKPNDVFEWTARPYALYLVETSTDGANWQINQAALPPPLSVGASVTTGSITVPRDPAQLRRFLRLKLAP